MEANEKQLSEVLKDIGQEVKFMADNTDKLVRFLKEQEVKKNE